MSEDWQGTISVVANTQDGEKELAKTRVESTRASAVNPIKQDGLSPQKIKESLKATIDFILGCQVRTKHSPLNGGLYTFYDLDAKTYRMPHWIWGWGPCVRLLLDASKIPSISSEYEKDRLYKAACEIGYTSTKFQVNNESHETHGLGTVRWDPVLLNPDSEIQYGYSEKISGGSDSNFLSGWAWIPLYEATKDRCFLDAAVLLAESTERLMEIFDLIPQDYAVDNKDWTDHTLDESGFGVEGIAELYRVTGDSKYKKIGRKYIEQHLSKLQRDDGLWERQWERSKNAAAETGYMTRGQGWAMEGLLASYRLTQDEKYLDMAVHLAEHLLKWQHDEGYWTFRFNRPLNVGGIDEKAVTLWSYLFYKLYGYTKDERHLTAARKALNWCINNQYMGHDPHACGAVIGVSRHSAVVYRRWFRVGCSYSSGFFGLAALEELKLG